MGGDDEMVGATKGGLRVTTTVGWGPSMLMDTPPPLAEVKAFVVQVVTPGAVGATAAKVKTTLCPGSNAVLPPLAVRLIRLPACV